MHSKSPKTRASNGLGFEARLPALGYSLPAFELLPCLSLLGLDPVIPFSGTRGHGCGGPGPMDAD